MKRQKVVLIHNIISPHVTPIFTELAKHTDLTVLYCAEKEDNRTWDEKPTEFTYKVLPHHAIKLKGKDLFTYFINPSIINELNNLKPDVVIIAGWDLFAYQAASMYCTLKRIPYILWSGSTQNEPSWRRTVSKPLVLAMVKGASAYIAYGSKARDYLVSLGADPKKIFISFNTTDLEKYRQLTTKYKEKAAQIKKQIGLKEEKVILYYGQLIERKGPDLLLEAFATLKTKDVALLLVGSGQYKSFLEKKKEGVENVYILDNPGDEEICKYYAIADLFVLPSREEVWGLVANQALAAGLPVVISDHTGASVDVVEDGINGYIFKSGSVTDLADKIDKVLDQKPKKMENESEKKMKQFMPQETVKGVLAALESIQK